MSKLAKKANARNFNVYVIELKKAVLNDKKFAEANPKYISGKPCVYVGMTGCTPEPPKSRLSQPDSGRIIIS